MLRRVLKGEFRSSAPTAGTAPVAELLNAYEKALLELESKSTEDSLATALSRRDRIAQTLASQPPSSQVMQRLVGLDRRLVRLATKAEKADWEAWRQALNPPGERWWWRLDERYTLPWAMISGTLIALAVALLGEFMRRVWSGGPDQVSVIGTVLVVALASTPFSQQWRTLVQSWMKRRGRPSLRRERSLALASLSLLIIMVCSYFLLLPYCAYWLNQHGFAVLQRGDLSGARQAFQRASSINPDYAEAFYNLAVDYASIGDDEEAINLYRKALKADAKLDVAYNGLGRTLILQGESERAVPILYTGLSLAEDAESRTALWTNLGWAYLEGERHHESKEAFAEALTLRQDDGSACCGFALVSEATNEPAEVLISRWEDCLRYAPNSISSGRREELETLAKAHLQQLEVQR